MIGRKRSAIVRLLGHAVGLCAYVVGYRRKHVAQALTRSGAGIAPLAFYRNLGASLVELLASGLGLVEPAVEFSRAAERLLSERRPTVFAVGHTGNWEWMAYACARKIPLAVLAKPLSIQFLNRALASIRARHGLRIVHSLEDVLRCLQEGISVAILIDQVPRLARHGQTEMFLGAPALVDRTAALVAGRAQCPLVFASAYRDGLSQHVDVVAKGIPSLHDAHAVTADLSAELQAFVRAHPTDWLWLHRRWGMPRSRSTAAGSLSPT